MENPTWKSLWFLVTKGFSFPALLAHSLILEKSLSNQRDFILLISLFFNVINYKGLICRLTLCACSWQRGWRGFLIFLYHGFGHTQACSIYFLFGSPRLEYSVQTREPQSWHQMAIGYGWERQALFRKKTVHHP